jgi:hypothetical protein
MIDVRITEVGLNPSRCEVKRFRIRSTAMTDRDSNVVALMPWDRVIRQARQRRKAIEILDRDDADRAIAALSEVEAYYAIKEIGLEDATPMLPLLSREQIAAILDLDVWRRNELDRSDLLYWLVAFRESGLEAFQRAARALDPEALAAFFARRLFIAFKPKENETDPEPIPEWLDNPPYELEPLAETPDGRFIIAAKTEDEEQPIDEEERKAILRLVEDLYRDDEDQTWIAGLLRLAMSDSPIELEEDALRFRNGRLEDLGFPPYERAAMVYSPESPSVLDAPFAPYPKNDMILPAVHASQLAEGLFHQAMQGIDSNELVRRIEGDLVPLANEILVADGMEPGALESLRESLARMRGYLEIGLAHGAEPPAILETAIRRLRTQPVRTLFRVGYGVTLSFKTRAQRLLAEKRFASMLSDLERAVLAALALKRPRVSGVILPMLTHPERIAYDEAQLADVCPWSPAAVAALSMVLEDLEGLLEVTRALKIDALEFEGVLEPPAEERTLELWLTTGAAHALIDGAFALAPLDGRGLVALADRLPLRDDRRFDRDAAIRVMDPLPAPAQAAAARRIRRGLDVLAENLWPLVGSGAIDPRFVGGVVRRLA